MCVDSEGGKATDNIFVRSKKAPGSRLDESNLKKLKGVSGSDLFVFKSKKLGLEAGSGKFRFSRLVPPKSEIGSEFFALGLIRLWFWARVGSG